MSYLPYSYELSYIYLIPYNDIVFPFGIDPDTGDYGYIKAGADTVTPFSSGAYLLARADNYRVDSGYSTVTATVTIATIDLSSLPFTVTTDNIVIGFSACNMETYRKAEGGRGDMSILKSITNNTLTVQCRFANVNFYGYYMQISYAIYAVPLITDLTE